MNIFIVVLLLFAIFCTGTLRLWWNGWDKTINCNWCALVALVLYIIENLH